MRVLPRDPDDMILTDEMKELVEGGVLSVREAGKFLNVSVATLYRLMERGELRYTMIGSSRRVPRRELVRMAATNMRGGWAMAEQ